MENIHVKILTVVNYGIEDDEKESKEITKTRVTLNPGGVHAVVGSYDTALTVDGIELRKVNVLMMDQTNLELHISLLDLETLERAVGQYLVP